MSPPHPWHRPLFSRLLEELPCVCRHCEHWEHQYSEESIGFLRKTLLLGLDWTFRFSRLETCEDRRRGERASQPTPEICQRSVNQSSLQLKIVHQYQRQEETAPIPARGHHSILVTQQKVLGKNATVQRSS